MDITSFPAILSNFFIYSIIYLTLWLTLTPKRGALVSVLLFFGGYALSFVPAALLYNTSVVRLALTMIIGFVPVLIVFSESFIKKLLSFICVQFLSTISEIITIVIVKADFSVVEHYYLMYLIDIVILLLLSLAYVLFVKAARKDNHSLIKYSDYFIPVLLVSSQTVSLAGWLSTIVENSGILSAPEVIAKIIVDITLCVFSDILIVIVLRRSIKARAIELENTALVQQVEAQYAHSAMLSEQYEAVRFLRHDIANHLYSVKALIDEGNLSEAQEYVNEVDREFEKTRVKRFCESYAVDAFLAAKEKEAESKGVRLNIRADIGNGIGISSTELITAIGNLLDNGIEACAGVADAAVGLSISEDKGYLNIQTENAQGAKTERAQRIRGMERGVGSYILKSLAEKYSGSYSTAAEGGLYTAKLHLKLPEAVR